MMKENTRVLRTGDRPRSRAGLRALLVSLPFVEANADAVKKPHAR